MKKIKLVISNQEVECEIYENEEHNERVEKWFNCLINGHREIVVLQVFKYVGKPTEYAVAVRNKEPYLNRSENEDYYDKWESLNVYASEDELKEIIETMEKETDICMEETNE